MSYFSEEDEMDVYVGIEGQSINAGYVIPIEELKTGSNYKLTLNIKAPQGQDQSPMHKNGTSSALKSGENKNEEKNTGRVDESQIVAVSLPDMVTNS